MIYKGNTDNLLICTLYVINYCVNQLNMQIIKKKKIKEPKDHWSCIAHLSAEDMLKSVVIEENKFNIALG